MLKRKSDCAYKVQHNEHIKKLMRCVIGLPRSLGYYYYHSIWEKYLTELGFTVKLSGFTNRTTIECGAKYAPNEACLPLKNYVGHVMQLHAQVDWVFIPRLVCTQTEPDVKLYCPKFIGLPDMVKALIPGIRILSVDIDLRCTTEQRSYVELARRLGCTSLFAQRAFLRATEKNTTLDQYNTESTNRSERRNLRIGLLGHAYVLRDAFLSFNIHKKLKASECTVIVWNENYNTDDFSKHRVEPMTWMHEEHILNTAYHYLHSGHVDGIVYLLSFGCGAGSITSEIIDYEIRLGSHVPILRIVIDEHTGEAGFETRLESFLDMIRMKQQKKRSTE